MLTERTSDKAFAYSAVVHRVRSESYISGSALVKREILWEENVRKPYETLPPVTFSFVTTVFRLLNLAMLRKAFTSESNDDVRPPRTKAFHPFGSLAKITFVSDGQHPFTGLFKTGAVGLARLSLALNENIYAPSAALKLFVDGQPSQHILMDQSLDMQTSRDFFERAPTNITIWPKLQLRYVWWLVNWWLSSIAPPLHQPLDHVAAVTSSGQSVTQRCAPFQIFLYASAELHLSPDSTEDFRIALGRIPQDSVLYRVFARAVHDSTDQIYIGYIRTDSTFVASEFGDRILAMQHSPTLGYTGPNVMKTVVIAIAAIFFAAAVVIISMQSWAL